MASKRAHLIVGGFPVGATAGHDMDFARIMLLQKLYDGRLPNHRWQRLFGHRHAARWHQPADDVCCGALSRRRPVWRHRELARRRRSLVRPARHERRVARRASEGSRRRRMVRLAHHDALGAFFLNHPPLSKFEVKVEADHPITAGLPANFETSDELYLVEPVGESRTLLTTRTAEGSVTARLRLRLMTRTRRCAKTARPACWASSAPRARARWSMSPLGHCHSPATNGQPLVDESRRRRRQDADGLPRLVGNRSLQPPFSTTQSAGARRP